MSHASEILSVSGLQKTGRPLVARVAGGVALLSLLLCFWARAAEPDAVVVLRETGRPSASVELGEGLAIDLAAAEPIDVRPGLVTREGRAQIAPGLFVRATLYTRHVGAGWWAEVSLENGDYREPHGYLEGEWALVVPGAGVVFRHPIAVPDGTGAAVVLGRPWWAPNEAGEALLAELPDVEVPPEAIARWAARPDDPDPTWNTHQVGSPRNELYALDASLCRYAPASDPRVLTDHVAAQTGTYRAGKWLPGRQYHYFLRDGRPYDAFDADMVDGQAPARFGEYGILIDKWGRDDSLGRRFLTEEQRRPSARNAYDFEHMAVERLYAAWVLLGSQMALRDIVLIAQTSLSRAPWEAPRVWIRGAWWSSRSWGWTVRMLVRCYQATGELRYLTCAREMLSLLWEDDLAFTLLGRGTSRADFALPFVLTREFQTTIWRWEEPPDSPRHNDRPLEACWQAAVTGSTLWLGYEVDPDEAWRDTWRACALDVAGMVSLCWREGAAEDPSTWGLFENYSPAAAGYLTGDVSLLGTRAWCLDTVARAWESGADGCEWCHVAWDLMDDIRAGGQYPFRPGGDFYHQWMPFVATHLGTHER